uniref:Cytochrome oxidase subunit 1 n=1 Tax=Brugia timori TaxID=42155 RepID=A0A0R3R8J1_9BILA
LIHMIHFVIYHPMSLMQNANGRLDPTDGRGNIVVHRRLSPTMIK